MIPRHRSQRSMPLYASAALVLTALAWPAPAAAQDAAGGEELKFDYGADGVSWYWSRQIDETLELGSVSQQVAASLRQQLALEEVVKEASIVDGSGTELTEEDLFPGRKAAEAEAEEAEEDKTEE